MNKFQRRVGKAKFEGIDGAYIIVSAQRRKPDDPLYDPLYNGSMIVPQMSFFFDNGNNGAEWNPPHGPIQVWCKAGELNDDTVEHYFYDFVYDVPMNWSQLAVERDNMHEAFASGNYEHIFGVLRRWSFSG